MKTVFAILVLAAVANASFDQGATQMSANPIRKVVNLLQRMQKKVQAEAKAGEDLFDKYMCYCKTGASDLSASIGAADTKIPEVASSIKEAEANKIQLDADLVSHRSDREAAKAAMAKATALREKEAKTYAAYKTEADTNIAAINKAVNAIDSGMSGGSFLQTNTAAAIRKLFQTQVDLPDIDRQDVLAFLAGGSTSGYSPQSGQISGILKQAGDDMSKALADTTSDENTSIKNYDDLMAAKTKEVAALTKSIEEKTVRSGEVAVNIVMMKEDLTDTQAALIDDTKFLQDLDKNCATKEAEWAVIKETRAQELVALADVIKLLNDDDALELFKKTLPSAASSFVQVEARANELRSKAMAVIRGVQGKANKDDQHMLDFVLLALRGKAMNFDKVIKMIDEMTARLKVEQTDDDNKKEYCAIQLDAMEDKSKSLDQTVSDADKAIADATDAIATLTSEIKALNAGIKALDKSVVEATEQRQKENEEFAELMASNTAAIDLIGVAKNRLNKFYNPDLYAPPAKRELSAEDRIAVNMGGTAPPTPAPGGIAGTGITAFVDVAAHNADASDDDKKPAPPPEAPSYEKKGEESTGVIAMMDMLVADLQKEITEAETEEKDAQSDYEQMSQDAAAKRIADTTSLREKTAAKANAEETLLHQQETKQMTTKELMATLEYISSLHAECDWLMQNFDMRKEARTNEVESLAKAKAVLSGADFSMLTQTRKQGLRGQKK
jgi:hypothetical protein